MQHFIRAKLVGEGWARSGTNLTRDMMVTAEITHVKIGSNYFILDDTQQLQIDNPEPGTRRDDEPQIALAEVKERVTLRDIFGAMPKEMTVIFPEEK